VSGSDQPGRVLGIDYGSKRVGLAISDPLRLTAIALEVVSLTGALNRIAGVVVEREVSEIVIGLPVGLSGREGPAAAAARNFARQLAEKVDVPVSFIDERYTTTTAEQVMLEAGVKRAQRRQSVDKVAATVILRSFLDRGR